VGGEFARVGLEACAAERRADGLGKGGKRVRGLHAYPEHACAARAFGVEGAELAELQVQWGRYDGGERVCCCFGAVAVDLADESQGEVQLVVGLPAGAFDADHLRGQDLADFRRGAELRTGGALWGLARGRQPSALRTVGRMPCTITPTPAGFGWIPSDSRNLGWAVTPFVKKG
jgi:hypothetical protein